MDKHACIYFLFHLNKMLFGRYEDSVLLTGQVILMRVRLYAIQQDCKAKLSVCVFSLLCSVTLCTKLFCPANVFLL